MTNETICIIRSALKSLRNLHEGILRSNDNPEVIKRALKGIERIDATLFEFDNFLSSHSEI